MELPFPISKWVAAFDMPTEPCLPKTTKEARIRRDVHRVSLNVKITARDELRAEDELLGKGKGDPGNRGERGGQDGTERRGPKNRNVWRCHSETHKFL